MRDKKVKVITIPKIKRTVHKVMRRYGHKRFYQKIDWIRKVLEKLKMTETMKMKQRIRNFINSWIQENKNLPKSEADSKSKILDKHKEQEQDKKSIPRVTEVVSETPEIPPVPKAIPISLVRTEKIEPEVITIEDDVQKKIKPEVITIEDDYIQEISSQPDVDEFTMNIRVPDTDYLPPLYGFLPYYSYPVHFDPNTMIMTFMELE